MYDIKEKDIVTVEQRLLFDIRELLTTKQKQKPKNGLIECRFCGGTHENQGQLMACAKKHKKR